MVNIIAIMNLLNMIKYIVAFDSVYFKKKPRPFGYNK